MKQLIGRWYVTQKMYGHQVGEYDTRSKEDGVVEEMVVQCWSVDLLMHFPEEDLSIT